MSRSKTIIAVAFVHFLDAKTVGRLVPPPCRFKFTTVCLLLVAVAATVSVWSSESERVLNLKDLQRPLFASANGKRLLLHFTNQPPVLWALIKPQPTPLKKRDSSQPVRKVQVLLGRDVIGFADPAGVSRDSLPTTGTNAAKRVLTTFVLTFDTVEQAAKAAEALRLPEVPKPLPRPDPTSEQ